MASKKQKLKKVGQRLYNRHPAGSPGSVGGQFAPVQGDKSHLASGSVSSKILFSKMIDGASGENRSHGVKEKLESIGAPPPSLTGGLAINAYTQHWDNPINSLLRGSDRPYSYGYKDEEIRLLCDELNNALNEMPKYKGTTYRAGSLPDEIIQKYKPGVEILEKGFTSTSSKQGVAQIFLEKAQWEIQPGSSPVVFAITGASGVDISALSQVPEEAEILYPLNQTYIVDKVSRQEDYIFIQMRAKNGNNYPPPNDARFSVRKKKQPDFVPILPNDEDISQEEIDDLMI